MKEELLKCLKEIEEKYPTIFVEAVNVDDDHLHLQIEIPPSLSVAEVVKRIKTFTSRKFRKKFKFINKMYFEKEWIWSVGYFSSTIWLNEEVVKKYIAYQWEKDVPSLQTSFEFS